MKQKTIKVIELILAALFVVILSLAFFGMYSMCSAQTTTKVTKCERCIKLEHAIIQVLAIIEEDETDYVLDVLSETDEYCTLYELLNENYSIPDSTYRKMRQVFPDLPAKQAPQWK